MVAMPSLYSAYALFTTNTLAPHSFRFGTMRDAV